MITNVIFKELKVNFNEYNVNFNDTICELQ